MGQAEQALVLCERALSIDDQTLRFSVQKAYCLLALKQFTQAKSLICSLADQDVKGAVEHDQLGNLFSTIKMPEQALEHFEAALLLEPERAHFSMNVALTRQALGNLSGAELAFDQSILADTSNSEAWLHRSRLRKQTLERNHVQELEARLREAKLPWRSEMNLRYALAKEQEDLQAYDDSFAHLTRGAKLRRSHMKHDADSDIQVMELIKSHFSRSYFSQPSQGCETNEPVFIVGLPRTGTTLVERILGSHSEVFAAGELNNFADTLTRNVLSLQKGQVKSREEFVVSSSQLDFKRLGEEYVASTRPYTGHCARFVDKLPLNFLYCGLIAKALPNAKIIHVQRHPMDSCFAMYKTLFKQAYPFSYDLKELGNYFIAYQQLTAHWQDIFPEQILPVSYENLVADIEGESRKMIDHCGLPWQEACLKFHSNPSPSTTASLAQVRQAVYTSSVDKWKHYEKGLQPLQEHLLNAGVCLD